MSKSNQRPLITARKRTDGTGTARTPTHTPAQTVWKRQTAAASRWLHIYLSMVSFAILFFFAVTGLTLNHASWFEGAQQTQQYKGSVEKKWVAAKDTAAIDKLAIVEFFRTKHGIKGALSDFLIDDMQCTVAFKGPGYSADAFITRENGAYELTETRLGLVAIVNDLHKGRDTGKSWSWIIDISAVLMAAVSLTGIILICFIKRRRFSGLVIAGVGLLVCYLIYAIWVP